MSTEICVREAISSDWEYVRGQMESVLSLYYGGDHKAHAERIFFTHLRGGKDKIGFFSTQQKMFIATIDNTPVGMLHAVLKRQGTCKISPLIVSEEFRNSRGIGKILLDKVTSYAKENACRQIYCTVSAKNSAALRFFSRHGFIIAGKSKDHYIDGMDEYMLYCVIENEISDQEFDIDHISVLPLEERHKPSVRRVLLEELPEDFQGIDDSWVDSLFLGYDRRDQSNVQSKFKLIFTATDRNDRVLGVVGATPKKGEPVKLMPFVAPDLPAFFALLSDVPILLRDLKAGRKVYVHIRPDSEQTKFLQRMGWRLDGVMPDSYLSGFVTQQWSKSIEREEFMRTMRLKKKYLDFMRAGRKTLEVRVAYDNLRDLKRGEQIAFRSREDRFVRDIVDIRFYRDFKEMLSNEDYKAIVPDLDENEVELLLREIYPPNKEKLGVIVIQVG